MLRQNWCVRQTMSVKTEAAMMCKRRKERSGPVKEGCRGGNFSGFSTKAVSAGGGSVSAAEVVMLGRRVCSVNRPTGVECVAGVMPASAGYGSEEAHVVEGEAITTSGLSSSDGPLL